MNGENFYFLRSVSAKNIYISTRNYTILRIQYMYVGIDLKKNGTFIFIFRAAGSKLQQYHWQLFAITFLSHKNTFTQKLK